MANDAKKPAVKIVIENELAGCESKMTFDELVQALSDAQDELQIRGWTEPAMLLHRALNRLTAITLTEAVSKRLGDKKRIA